MTQEAQNLILESLGLVHQLNLPQSKAANISGVSDNKETKAVTNHLTGKSEGKAAADEDTKDILNKIYLQETWQ